MIGIFKRIAGKRVIYSGTQASWDSAKEYIKTIVENGDVIKINDDGSVEVWRPNEYSDADIQNYFS